MAENNTTNTNFDLSFKYGEFKNLPTTLSNGTIYVTTDDKTMYVDLDGKRIRLGDISIHKDIADLAGDKANWYKGALAYIESSNHLAYFNGTEWKDINDPDVKTKIDAAIAQEVIDRNAAIEVEKDRATTAENALSEKITGVEEALEGITGGAGSLKTLEDNLKKYTDDAKAELIGGDTDTTTAKTIAGAKAFATNAAGNAITTANEYAEDQIEGLDISYDSINKKVILKNKAGTQVSEFDATDFIKDGMLDNATYDASTNEITLTWNTDAGKTAMKIDLESLVDTYTGGNGISVTDKGVISIDGKVVVTHTDLNTSVGALEGKITAAQEAAETYADGKASAAETAAKTYADGKASAAETAAKTYADSQASAAQSAAEATAAADATTKANAAKEAAISAAATDATTKANNAQAAAISAAATDATTKANAAEAAAKTYAEGQASAAQTNAEATASADATTKANAAKEAAISAAATDATTKANAAKEAAISAAATDATTKADAAEAAAKIYAEGQASAAQSNAEATAAADATAKANAAKSAAEATAAADATTKANAAKEAAISAAATDATTKANAAEAAAKSHAETKASTAQTNAITESKTYTDSRLTWGTFN